MQRLPIDEVISEIVSAARAARCVVVEAPPGAGKTTRVPPALLDEGLAGEGEVVVLQPRRIATRLAARRVAEERGEKLGETVGYRIRFDDVGGPRTRLRFVTEGVLSRTLASDPDLSRVGLVVLDEFHERHVHADLALALCRRLQHGPRPDLGIVVMSATLDASPIGRFLGDCPVVRTSGRMHDVTVSYLPRLDRRPLSAQVASALHSLLETELEGDVLVFLPGAAEIRRAHAACDALAHDADLELVTLHGNLPAADQDRALAPCARRKVILSTNVAESSVTIEGVVAVIDSGLARVAGHAPWSGLPTLRTAPISRASATQRAGRAGRTRPGRCWRLYTKADHDGRPAHAEPEITRVDLADVVLALRAHGIARSGELAWLEPPPAAALKAADELLASLGACAADGSLTALGRRLLRFPAHPRIARLLIEAEQRDVVPDACLAAAVLTERDIAIRRRTRPAATAAVGAGAGASAAGEADLGSSVELFRQAAEADFAPAVLRALGVDRAAARAVDRARRQFDRLCSHPVAAPRLQAAADDWVRADEAVRLCLLAGFPDRVAKRVRDEELALVGGGAARLAAESAAGPASFLVALDAEERHDERGRQILVRTACPIEPDWLLELFPEAIETTSEHVWNEATERVESVERLLYHNLVLEQARSPSPPGERTTALLRQAAEAQGPHAFAPEGALDRWLNRLQVLRDAMPEAKLPAIEESDLQQQLYSLCAGRCSFTELRQAGLLGLLQSQLDPAQQQQLNAMAPERIVLPGGRRLDIHYEAGRPPWVASRLQDFFGMAQGPTIASGRLPLVLHLLAPNGRPVQVTSDLASFWQEAYPSVRRGLARRYPKHDWPEDGRTAKPPPPGRLKAR